MWLPALSLTAFVTIQPGTFVMGSPATEWGRTDEEVLHTVSITAPFELQSTEVTQEQWVEVMGANPSRFSHRENCPERYKEQNGVGYCPELPVEDLAFTEAETFLSKLNASQSEYTYRLPTEAEWEYAARAGSQSPYSFGYDVSDLTKYAWFDTNAKEKTHPVGALAPNAWGLYDMHGNVWELVADWHAPYGEGGTTDPRGPLDGLTRSLRGGSWYDRAEFLRSAQRNEILPGTNYSDVGLRLSRTRR